MVLRPNNQKANLIYHAATMVIGIGYLLTLLVFAKIEFRKPMGTGDLLFSYAQSERFFSCNPSSILQNGFPAGIQFAYFPSSDWIPNLFINTINCISNNSFLGVNIYWLFTFAATLFVTLQLCMQLQINRFLVIPTAFAIAFLPYHWVRLSHVYLTGYFSLLIGLFMAISIYRCDYPFARTQSRHSGKIFWVIGLILVGWSGIYYAIFTCMLILIALFLRFAFQGSLREIFRDSINIVAITLILTASFIPTLVANRQNPLMFAASNRSSTESVLYSGNFAKLFTISPESGLTYLLGLKNYALEFDAIASQVGFPNSFESGSHGNILSVFSFFALPILLVLFLRIRSNLISHRHPLVFLTSAFLFFVLFFMPWGLNFMFSELVTPQIRAWGRIEPLLQTIGVLIVAIILSSLIGVKSKRLVALLSLFATVLLFIDTSRPLTKFVKDSAKPASIVYDEAHDYGKQVNELIGEDCGVLVLPYFPFPENGPVNGISDYDHLMVSLANPEKNFSYGSMKGSSLAEWFDSLGDVIDIKEQRELSSNGFCFIHVDLRGYVAEEKSKVTENIVEGANVPDLTSKNGYWIGFKID